MQNVIARQRQALELIERIVDLAPDQGTLAYALKMRERLKLPMTVVMEAVPGLSVAEKVRLLGISRPTYYGWVDGRFRPDTKMARRLAKLTGHSEDEIRGRKTLWDR